jgi:hypothetical protein
MRDTHDVESRRVEVGPHKPLSTSRRKCSDCHKHERAWQQACSLLHDTNIKTSMTFNAVHSHSRSSWIRYRTRLGVYLTRWLLLSRATCSAAAFARQLCRLSLQRSFLLDKPDPLTHQYSPIPQLTSRTPTLPSKPLAPSPRFTHLYANTYSSTPIQLMSGDSLAFSFPI